MLFAKLNKRALQFNILFVCILLEIFQYFAIIFLTTKQTNLQIYRYVLLIQNFTLHKKAHNNIFHKSITLKVIQSQSYASNVLHAYSPPWRMSNTERMHKSLVYMHSTLNI